MHIVKIIKSKFDDNVDDNKKNNIIVSPGKRNRLYDHIPKVIFSRDEGVIVYCFTGLSNERLKSNVLPVWEIFCWHFFGIRLI